MSGPSYSNIISVEFTEPGTQSYYLEGIKADNSVTVTCLNTGKNYKLESDKTQEKFIPLDAYETPTVNFELTYDGGIVQSSVVTVQIVNNEGKIALENIGESEYGPRLEVECVDDQITVNVDGVSEVENQYVRAKIYNTSDINVNGVNLSSKWVLNTNDGYYYYQDVVEAGAPIDEPLTMEVTSSTKNITEKNLIIVVEEVEALAGPTDSWNQLSSYFDSGDGRRRWGTIDI